MTAELLEKNATIRNAGLICAAGGERQASAFTCAANAGTPVIVRVEGIAEVVGDLLLQCTDGNPTTAGRQVPVTRIKLSLNTNITGLLLGSGFSEAATDR